MKNIYAASCFRINIKSSCIFLTIFFLVINSFAFAVPSNDDPCGATSLTVGSSCSFVAETSAGATNSSGIPATGCNYTNKDVWFTAVVPANGTLTIDTQSGSITDSGIAFYRGTCGSLTYIGCDDDSGAGFMSNLSSTSLVPGETIWIRFWKYGGGTGTFSICASSPPAMPACAGNAAAGEACSTSTPICNLDGYCGNTSSSYTVDTWSQLTSAFCGSLENDSYISFVASATSMSFNVWETSTIWGDGIQIMVFSASTCGSGPVTSYVCWNVGYYVAGPTLITAPGLTIGNTYYILVDGYAGDVCDYVIGVPAGGGGVALPTAVTPTSQTICLGSSVTLTGSGGNGVYNWTGANTADLSALNVATVTATPTTVGVKTYTVNSTSGASGCPSASSASAVITVNAANTAAAPSSSPTVCVNTLMSSITIATTGATGISNSGVSGANGLPAGVSATWSANTITISGTPTTAVGSPFSYSIPLTGGCGTVSASGTITVITTNTAAAPSSSPTVCVNTLMSSITIATVGATGISNSGVSGANGLPAGVSATWSANTITISGTPTTAVGSPFSYSIPLTGGCGTVSASGTITVNPVLVPSVSIVSSDADNTICAGTSVTFTATPTNGGAAPIYQWYLNGAPVGTGGTTYTTTGLVNGDIVTCILTSNAVCASPLTGTSSGITTTVNPLSTIALASASTTSNQQVCINAPINTILYSVGGSATGATITGLPAGVSSAFAGGLIAITGTPTSSGSYTYTVATTGGCTPAAALSGVIDVIAMPVVAPITGTTNICVGTASLLNDATATGVWTSSSASASVGSTGLVLGLSAGSSIINYMVTINGCSTTVSTTVNVLTFPIVAPISGPTSVCEGSMIDLNDASLSGIWASSSTAIATINSAGEVVGISAGTATMTYTISNGVCSTSSSYVITVNPLPIVAAITGSSVVCEGDSILLSDITPAGVWTTDSTLIASVNPLTGMVTGDSAGVAIISYVITDLSCSANVSTSITVNPLPVVAPIIAPADVCQGDSILFSDLAPGGVWTSESLLIATINSSGMLTALSAGTSVIDYEVTLLGCSSQQTSTVTVYGTPAAPLNSGDSTYCSTAILSDLTAISGLGGTLTWYSDSTLLTVLGEGSSLAPTSAIGTNTYYITETVSGCEGLASAISINITICAIEIVTAFTPDGDLKNDKWILPDIDKSFPKNVVYIYNRWGTLIFQSEQGQYEMKPWDGTYNGKALPVDSYFYMIEYNDDYTTGSKGNVSIIIVQ